MVLQTSTFKIEHVEGVHNLWADFACEAPLPVKAWQLGMWRDYGLCELEYSLTRKRSQRRGACHVSIT
jgi:hypothetical protein